MDLKNRTILVSGGSSGIGLAIARILRGSGARVAITGRNDVRLTASAREIGAIPIRADVTSEADVVRTFEVVDREFGELDVLVNNAGFGVFKPLVEMDRKSFDSVLATNVTGAMLMGREAARRFVAQNHGNIVNMGSTAGLRGAPRGTAYMTSKFALRGMTECWRAELRSSNVRVFLINPSEVLTSFASVAGFAQKDNPTKLHAEDIAHVVKSVLEMDDRGFTTELTVFATNPKD